MISENKACLSASIEGDICLSRLPYLDTKVVEDGYSDFGAASYCEQRRYNAHSDAIWDLDVHPSNSFFASASVDGTCKVFDYARPKDDAKATLRETRNRLDSNDRVPLTSCRFHSQYPGSVLCGYVNGEVLQFDIETGKVVAVFTEDSASSGSKATTSATAGRIYAMDSDPSTSCFYVATEDRKVHIYDIKSKSRISSIRAHSDSVTSVSVHPQGGYIASASHDCQIRMWDLKMYRCIQDLQGTHRKKLDEGILSLRFHRTMGLLASGGADSVVRIYSGEES